MTSPSAWPTTDIRSPPSISGATAVPTNRTRATTSPPSPPTWPPCIAGLGWSGELAGRWWPIRAGGATWCSNWPPAILRPSPGGSWAADGATLEVGADASSPGRQCLAALTPPRPAPASAPWPSLETMIRTWHPDWSDAGVAGTLANMQVLPDGTITPWLTLPRHLQVVRHLQRGLPPARSALAAPCRSRGARLMQLRPDDEGRRPRPRGGAGPGPGAGWRHSGRRPRCARVQHPIGGVADLLHTFSYRPDEPSRLLVNQGLGRNQPHHGEDPPGRLRPS